MYKFITGITVGLVIMVLPLFFILVGQWLEQASPENPTAIYGFLGCLFGAGILSLGLAIYDKGMEAAREELEPEE